MEEQNTNELLEKFTQLVSGLDEKLNKILDAYQTAENEFNENEKSKAWNEKFGDRLSKYDKDMKAINGPDFDILVESRKEYEDEYSDFTDDEYVDALEKNLTEAIDNLKTALNEGDVQEAAHAAEEVENVASEAAEQLDEEAHKEITEEPANENANEEEHANEEAENEEDDELANFTADLEADKEHFDAIEEAKKEEEEEDD